MSNWLSRPHPHFAATQTATPTYGVAAQQQLPTSSLFATFHEHLTALAQSVTAQPLAQAPWRLLAPPVPASAQAAPEAMAAAVAALYNPPALPAGMDLFTAHFDAGLAGSFAPSKDVSPTASVASVAGDTAGIVLRLLPINSTAAPARIRLRVAGIPFSETDRVQKWTEPPIPAATQSGGTPASATTIAAPAPIPSPTPSAVVFFGGSGGWVVTGVTATQPATSAAGPTTTSTTQSADVSANAATSSADISWQPEKLAAVSWEPAPMTIDIARGEDIVAFLRTTLAAPIPAMTA